MTKSYRYRAIVSYDGSDYYGFQRLNNRLSIQKTIEKAFKNMTSQDILIFVAGRTDKGVHAKGQVFHFDTTINLDNKTWIDGLNRRLPDSIRIIKIQRVKSDFHARHSAKSKKYEYLISKVESSVFRSRYELYQPNLDVDKIINATKLLIGTHDFGPFSVYIENKPTIKTIYSINVIETKTHIKIQIHGDSFLRYMVRRIVGLLIEIGLGKKDVSVINEIFETNSRNIANKTAPAKGLYLVKIFY